jgi:ABC-type transport system involved in multi-copper enzyme maturation permease subunit
MFLRLLQIEVRKLLKHPLLWLGLAGLLGIFALYFAARYALIANAVKNGLVNTRGLELDLQIGLGLFNFFSILFFAAVGSLVSAYDYPDRGVQIWLVRGVSRPLLMLARLVVVLLFGFVLVTISMFAILGFAALMRTLFLSGYTAQDLDWAQMPFAILRVFWSSVPYLALTVLCAVISRSPLFAAGGTLVFRTVLENLLLHLSDRFPHLTRLLPSQLAFVLYFNTYRLDRSASAMTLTDQFLTEPQACLAIAGLLLVSGVATLAIFSRQDWGG